MATEISRHLFTVDDYHRMVDAGILHEDDRVELIRGEVVAMSPIGPPHNGSVIRITNLLMPLLSGSALLSAQGAVRLDLFSEPQPDIVLLRPRDDFYSQQHPGPTDMVLIIEVADSSLGYDRTVKAELYAETGVAEYWVADISNDAVWVYRHIQDQRYKDVRQFQRGVTITPQLLPACPIPVDILLP